MATIGVTRGLGDHDLKVHDSNIYIKPFLSPAPEVPPGFSLLCVRARVFGAAPPHIQAGGSSRPRASASSLRLFLLPAPLPLQRPGSFSVASRPDGRAAYGTPCRLSPAHVLPSEQVS